MIVEVGQWRREREPDVLPDDVQRLRAAPRIGGRLGQDIRFTLAAPLAYFNDQIVIASSTDGGLTWTDPKRVSENKLTQAFTGSVEVDERGAVGVTYYDFTNDDPAGGPLDTDYWATGSRDGMTFTPRERITAEPFDMRTAPDARGFFLGDYGGLASVGRRFAPVFVAANTGNTANRTDVFSTTFQPNFRGSALAAAANVRLPANVRKLAGRVDALPGFVRTP